MLFQHIKGVNYPVIIVGDSLKDYLTEMESLVVWDTILPIVTHGGVFCISWTSEAVHNPELWDGKYVHCDERVPGFVPVIVCHEMIANSLGGNIVAAFLHEEGHIINGDIDVNSDPDVSGIKLLDNIDHEIRADAYAASMVGKKKVKKAILRAFKTLWHINPKIQKKYKSPKRMLKAIRKNTNMKKRMAALDSA
jgi:hypothetical protein